LNLSVIIVNYNVKYFLEQCLCSVTRAGANIDMEIFVVDNNSSDGSKEYLESKFPRVIFKWKKSNEGFAKANNSVLDEAKGDHVLFLNPDTIVPEDCFEKCLAFFKTNNNIAAIGVQMIDGSGKYLPESKRSFPSPAASFYKMAGLASLFPRSRVFAKYYAGHLSEKQNNEVDVLAGAFMMISRPVLLKLKGFDEDYFMYGEDIDLSYRIQKAGYLNCYFAGTTIIHFKGESTTKNSYQYISRFYGAMNLFVRKHYRANRVILLLMKASIVFSKLISLIAVFFKKPLAGDPSKSKPQQTAVLCDQQQFDAVIHLLKYSKTPIVINGRIAVDDNDTGIAIGKMENTEVLINKKPLDQLVFCEGTLSFKTIIEKMQQLSGKSAFLIHAKGSGSLVGSGDKNDKGVFITKNPEVEQVYPTSQ
jgi:N-acetylglucosaminyl-diphospho-decaprenol L-rhamnosyltransferase